MSFRSDILGGYGKWLGKASCIGLLFENWVADYGLMVMLDEVTAILELCRLALEIKQERDTTRLFANV